MVRVVGGVVDFDVMPRLANVAFYYEPHGCFMVISFGEDTCRSLFGIKIGA